MGCLKEVNRVGGWAACGRVVSGFVVCLEIDILSVLNI